MLLVLVFVGSIFLFLNIVLIFFLKTKEMKKESLKMVLICLLITGLSIGGIKGLEKNLKENLELTDKYHLALRKEVVNLDNKNFERSYYLKIKPGTKEREKIYSFYIRDNGKYSAGHISSKNFELQLTDKKDPVIEIYEKTYKSKINKTLYKVLMQKDLDRVETEYKCYVPENLVIEETIIE